MRDVKIFFTNGPILIGDVVSEDATGWTVFRPCTLAISNQGANFFPLFELTAEDEFHVSTAETLYGGPKAASDSITAAYVNRFLPQPPPPLAPGVMSDFELTTSPQPE